MLQTQDILDNISTGIIALDTELVVRGMNASAQALLELSEARTVGLHARELVLRGKEWLASLSGALESNTTQTRRGMPLLLTTGQEIHVDLMINHVVDEGEAKTALLVELQPIDRLLRITREEAMASSHETTRAVVRGLAHEIKNPLGGVRGAAQLLARELPDPQLAEYTSVIIREADRLRDLVDKLLGPNQRLTPEALNIHETLEHVRNLIAAESGNRTTVERDYDPSLPELNADRSQLIQALLNIMRNALQAARSPEECVITIRTRSQRQFTIGTHRHRLVCRVDISDNGPGIPADLLPSIFVPMVTGRADGTGLGLSISQSIINRHGGLLECSSSPGHTQFTLYLPMESSNA